MIKTRFDLSVVNYAHGGGFGPTGITACHTWDFMGLRRMMRGQRWPDVLVCCEGERWGFTGGKGAWAAAAALRTEQREAGLAVRPYVPLLASLTQNRGPIAPVVFVDPVTVAVVQFFGGSDPDAFERTRNLVRLAPAEAPEQVVLDVVPQHWAWNNPVGRVLDAGELLRYGREAAPPTVVCGDFNCSASGEDISGWNQQGGWHTARHSAAWRGHPDDYDFTPLDMLIGVQGEDGNRRSWPGGHRPGLSDVAELARDDTATEPPVGPRRHRRNMRFLANQAAQETIVDGSYQVHSFLDDANPDSDHRRISVTMDVRA